MNNSNDILNELQQISPLLANIEKVNIFFVPEGYFNYLHERITDYAILNKTSSVYNVKKRDAQHVPDGYFNSLSNSILAKIKLSYGENSAEELQPLSPLLSSLKNKNVFTVPNNYFETISNVVFEKINVDEAEVLSPLLSSLKDKNVFTIPDNYFETIGKIVTEKINADKSEVLSPLLSSLKDKNVFTVPNNYFETISKIVTEKINVDKSEVLSPLLSSLKNKNIFTVPDNYFNTLPANISNKLQQAPAKVISINKNRSWWRYAAAAVITGVIAITSLQIFNNSNQHTTVLPQYIQESFQYKTENDVNAGIAKLSDDDIAKYLEKNGNVLDNSLLITNTDVSEMPSQSDYLNDENTLNEYLDKIDAASNNNNSKP